MVRRCADTLKFAEKTETYRLIKSACRAFLGQAALNECRGFWQPRQNMGHVLNDEGILSAKSENLHFRVLLIGVYLVGAFLL